MRFSRLPFLKLAPILIAGGLLSGFLLSFVVTPRYVSHAQMTMGASLADAVGNRSLPEHLFQLQNEILRRTSLSSIIQDPRLELYLAERSKTPLEDVIDNMRKRDIRITRTTSAAPGSKYLSFDISFAYPDRLKAQATVQALITRFEEANVIDQRVPAYVKRQRSYDQIDRMEARVRVLEKKLNMPLSLPELANELEPVEGAINMEVLDPPSLPVNPEFPDPLRFTEAGSFVGFIAAILLAIFRRKQPPIPFPAQLA
jgi:hypothetical protein